MRRESHSFRAVPASPLALAAVSDPTAVSGLDAR